MIRNYKTVLGIIFLLLSLFNSSYTFGHNHPTTYKSTISPPAYKPASSPHIYKVSSLPTYKPSKLPPAYKPSPLPNYRAPSRSRSYKPESYIAENGSYRGEISKRTNRPKNTHVKGYYRKNGTYVRGHYKSKRR